MHDKTKVLVYVREYFKKVYVPMFDSLKEIEVDYVTNFPTRGMHDIRGPFNVLLQAPTPLEFKLDEDDIILRCRLLRNVDRSLAVRMLRAMQGTMERILDRSHHMVFGPMVDDYITHLMVLVARCRGIRYFGVNGSYFEGVTHVTLGSDGSPVAVRSASVTEAMGHLDKISSADFRQNYLQPTAHDFVSHAKRVLRYHAKLLAFPLLKHYRRDPLNYHYIVQPFLGQAKSLSNHVDDSHFHPDWEQQIRQSKDPLIYFPLGYTPEATTDYWIKDASWIDYEKKVLELARFLSPRFKVIVKEHVHMLGIRDKRFYKALASLENVVSVPPTVNSNRLLLTYRPVMFIGGGSAGVEATIRKMAVVSYCGNSYWVHASAARQVGHDLMNELPDALMHAQPADVDPIAFIQSCLKTTFSFDFMKSRPLEGSDKSEILAFIDAERKHMAAARS